MEASLEELIKMVPGKLQGDLEEKELKKTIEVSTDSRSIKKGQVYWALEGEKFDGHEFVEDSFKKGCRLAVVNRSWFRKNGTSDRVYINVNNTNESLLEYSKNYCQKFTIPKIAVTGSNGKTTTKEMIMAVLSKGGKVHGTEKNLNNQFGVPFTLFGLNKKHKYLVVEMGTNHPGEIEVLSKAVEAEIAVITNVSYNHVEFFDSLDAIYKEKTSIVNGMSKPGTLIANGDDPYFKKMTLPKGIDLITFGIESGDIKAEDLKFDTFGCGIFTVGEFQFRLRIPGKHNVYNALAAIIAGNLMGIPNEKMSEALEALEPTGRRLKYHHINGLHMYDDCYNASPASMTAALEVIENLVSPGKKIVVLADMLELGGRSRGLHEEVGEKVLKGNIDVLITYGADSEFIGKGAVAHGFPSKNHIHYKHMGVLKSYLRKLLTPGDIILIKGSRGMKLERVSEFIKRMFG